MIELTLPGMTIPNLAQLPSVGRIVHFFPAREDADTVMWSGGAPLAAIVTFVHNERLVNLTIFGIDGALYARSGVVFGRAFDARYLDKAFCHFPDRRIG